MAKKVNDRFSFFKFIISILVFLFMVSIICIFFDGNGVFIYETF